MPRASDRHVPIAWKKVVALGKKWSFLGKKWILRGFGGGRRRRLRGGDWYGGGRRRRDRARGEDECHLFLRGGLDEATALEDMLLPEGQEEL